MATHSSLLAGKSPQTEDPGRLQFMGSQKVRYDWAPWSISAEQEEGMNAFFFPSRYHNLASYTLDSHLVLPSPRTPTPPPVQAHSVVSNSLWPHGLEPTRLLCPRDSPGKNTGVGTFSLNGLLKEKTINVCSLRAFLLILWWTVDCLKVILDYPYRYWWTNKMI